MKNSFLIIMTGHPSNCSECFFMTGWDTKHGGQCLLKKESMESLLFPPGIDKALLIRKECFTPEMIVSGKIKPPIIQKMCTRCCTFTDHVMVKFIGKKGNKWQCSSCGLIETYLDWIDDPISSREPEKTFQQPSLARFVT